ncbi:MAG TPA: M1 family metallopeptidase [Chitinophagaceae bacterium]|nr:M1 family metallopeptidase [Chitinophagaceae bacterium]
MNKRFLPLLLLLLPIAALAQRKIDAEQYRFFIEVNDQNDTIEGKAEIRFRFLNPSQSVNFDLYKTNGGKGMKVSEVKGRGIRGFSQAAEQLSVFFSNELPANDTMTLTIVYKGVPQNGLIISKNKYGNRTFFGDNWPNRAHHWLPCVDDPADKAPVEFIVTAPNHYQVVANGVLTEENNLSGNRRETHWKETVPLPAKVMVIGVAEFAVQHIGNAGNCIPVSSWVFPENKKDGFYDYETARDVLNWHISYTGPYAYQKLANVQSKTMFGGMENASAIFYYEGSVTGNRSEEELQSHEIVHQWFGNHATEKSFAHLWLSEGFATYLTHVYMESKYGTDSLNKRMAADRTTVIEFVKESHRPVVDTTHEYMRLLNANSYQKGGWILHMLRRELGDTVFHKSIRDYYAAYGGKNADSRDLQQIFENNAGKKLDGFFEQWLHRPVNPKLDISWKMLPGNKAIEITVIQLQEGPAFTFPLELGLDYKGKSTEAKEISISKKTETFSIPVAAELETISVDPNVSLLFEGQIKGQ